MVITLLFIRHMRGTWDVRSCYLVPGESLRVPALPWKPGTLPRSPAGKTPGPQAAARGGRVTFGWGWSGSYMQGQAVNQRRDDKDEWKVKGREELWALNYSEPWRSSGLWEISPSSKAWLGVQSRTPAQGLPCWRQTWPWEGSPRLLALD